ncbi:MAPEG family protein [Celeribacter ethanolicus]|uniref:MAPEG family protein n=1 Tax=Celeribacter ethanolicus TaxID=1758178 RepID=UPI0018E09CE4|nr:MAPEG family protein [Celeribacter ethanolicus]
MTLTLTAFYAGLTGLLYLSLSIHVIKQRLNIGQGLGDGGDDTLNRRIRAHGNFNEYAPLTLVLIAGFEAMGAPPFWFTLPGLSSLSRVRCTPTGCRAAARNGAANTASSRPSPYCWSCLSPIFSWRFSKTIKQRGQKAPFLSCDRL